jgi:hypothetical protein
MSSLISALQSLLDQQSIPYSKWPKREIEFLDRQVMLGSLGIEQLPNGRRVLIVNNALLMGEILVRFPNFGTQANPQTRHEAVLALKDAHQSNTTYPTLAVRRLCNSGTISFNGREVDVFEISKSFLSILESELTSWLLSGKIVLIENLEPFLHAELVHTDFDFAVYYAGTISSEVLAWISTQDVEILMAPDYDPVGLSQFEKVRSVANPRLWIPSDITEKFETYHNKDALLKQNNRAIMISLYERTDLDSCTLDIVELISKYQGCLHQEIFYPVGAVS